MPKIIAAGDNAHALAEALAPRLRAADVAEVQAAAGLSPLEGLTGNLSVSGPASWAIVDDEGDPLALFGAADCTHLGEGVGAPWLLGSDALVTRYRAWMIRNTQRIIRTPDTLFRRYFNYVDARNTVHIRWLRWSGFVVMPAVPWGPFGLPFHPFYRRVPNV